MAATNYATKEDLAKLEVRLVNRIAGLETTIPHLGTKEDLQKLKVWWLVGVVGGMGAAAAVALGILRFFF